MKVGFLTIFPHLVNYMIQNLSLTKRSIRRQKVEFKVVDVRGFCKDKHLQVDDYIFGSKKGMIMRFDVLLESLIYCKNEFVNPYVILPSPRGRVICQYTIKDLSKLDELIFICPNYEGVDDRILRFVNEELSIGDYVISSGELASFVILEAILRYKFIDSEQPLVDKASVLDDSFNYAGMDCLLEPLQYTRPRVLKFNNFEIPVEEYVYSGNHEQIRKNNIKNAINLTIFKKPHLIKKFLNKYYNTVDKKLIFEAFLDFCFPS
ncbi:MAG: hypothetical protein ABDH21_03180 [bacterium]